MSSIQSAVMKVVDATDWIHVPLTHKALSLRHNVFLNYQRVQGTFFENMGNFFLTPFRYVFGGKNVTKIDANGCTFERCFKHEKDSPAKEMVKTVFAILSLPIVLLLGSCFKGLAYLSQNVRTAHAAIRQEVFSKTIVHHDDAYKQIAGVPELFSSEVVPHENYPHPGLKPKQQEQVQGLLDVASVLEQAHIPYWLDCGTLLGARRHGTMIPWDADVDMGVLAPDHQNIMRALRQLDPKKYEVHDWSSNREPEMCIRVFLKSSKSYLDIYHHVIDPDKKTICYRYSWRDYSCIPDVVKRRETVQEVPIDIAHLFPLKQAQFAGTLVRVPADWKPVLQAKYGENLDPCKIWNPTTKQFDRVPDHPYWQRADY